MSGCSEGLPRTTRAPRTPAPTQHKLLMCTTTGGKKIKMQLMFSVPCASHLSIRRGLNLRGEIGRLTVKCVGSAGGSGVEGGRRGGGGRGGGVAGVYRIDYLGLHNNREAGLSK